MCLNNRKEQVIKMKKGLTIFLVILATVFAVGMYVVYAKFEAEKTVPKGDTVTIPEKEVRMVKVKGKVYSDTGKISDALRCGMMDGQITSHVATGETPTEDNQSNFEGEYGYQYGQGDNTIEIQIDGNWYIFEAKEQDYPFFYGKVVESSVSHILVEPNEGEKIRKSADKIFVGLGEYGDAIYMEGTNVKITYTGDVMETYPAQIKATKIEIKSAENFELRLQDKQPQTDEKVHQILSADETAKQDYNVYTYGGTVNILINGEEMSLRDALLQDKITMNEIISKANEDVRNEKIQGNMYRDGGSMLYQYQSYAILKCHTVDGNRDVYIGTPDMTINDVLK